MIDKSWWIYQTLLAISIVCTSQYLRVFRWRRLVYKHGAIDNNVLSRSIGISYLGNLFLPFRLGEIIRLVYLRKEKFGTTASLIAIVTERIFDSIFLTFFFGLYFFFNQIEFQVFLLISFGISLILAIILYVLLKPKTGKLRLIGMFSEDIVIRLHQIAFQIFLSVTKVRVNLLRIILLTALINFGVFCSIILFSKIVNEELAAVANVLIFDLSNSISLALTKLETTSSEFLFAIAYLLLPIVVLMAPISNSIRKGKYVELSNEAETLRDIVLLESRTANNDAYFKEAISSIVSKGKKGLTVLQSETLRGEKLVEVLQGGGSGDHVFLIQGEAEPKVRKAAAGTRRDFLKAQNNWMRAHQDQIPLVKAQPYMESQNTVYYDMKYIGRDSSFFTILHCRSISESTQLLLDLLQKLKSPSIEESRSHNFDAYIDAYRPKIVKSYEIIEEKNLSMFLIKPLVFKGRTLSAIEMDSLSRFLSSVRLPLFENWVMHGDLTVSNMLIGHDNEINLIDPNPIQPFSHPTVDFGKLLQSFKCGYEFDYSTPSIIQKGQVLELLSKRSATFAEMEHFLLGWIASNYNLETIFHSKIQLLLHLIRVIPYSQNSDQVRWLIFQMRIVFTELISDLV